MAKVDKVKPLKIENTSDGSQDDASFYTELNPSEDYVAAKGLAFTNLDTHIIDTLDNEIAFLDPVNGRVKLSSLGAGSGMTPETHAALDQLVHNLAESNYYEITKEAGRVTAETWWTNSGKTIKIREVVYTYNLGKIVSSALKQYNASGILLNTYTETYTWTGNEVTSIDGVYS